MFIFDEGRIRIEKKKKKKKKGKSARQLGRVYPNEPPPPGALFV
jgi:hypothetical protein